MNGLKPGFLGEKKAKAKKKAAPASVEAEVIEVIEVESDDDGEAVYDTSKNAKKEKKGPVECHHCDKKCTLLSREALQNGTLFEDNEECAVSCQDERCDSHVCHDCHRACRICSVLMCREHAWGCTVPKCKFAVCEKDVACIMSCETCSFLYCPECLRASDRCRSCNTVFTKKMRKHAKKMNAVLMRAAAGEEENEEEDIPMVALERDSQPYSGVGTGVKEVFQAPTPAAGAAAAASKGKGEEGKGEGEGSSSSSKKKKRKKAAEKAAAEQAAADAAAAAAKAALAAQAEAQAKMEREAEEEKRKAEQVLSEEREAARNKAAAEAEVQRVKREKAEKAASAARLKEKRAEDAKAARAAAAEAEAEAKTAKTEAIANFAVGVAAAFEASSARLLSYDQLREYIRGVVRREKETDAADIKLQFRNHLDEGILDMFLDSCSDQDCVGVVQALAEQMDIDWSTFTDNMPSGAAAAAAEADADAAAVAAAARAVAAAEEEKERKTAAKAARAVEVAAARARAAEAEAEKEKAAVAQAKAAVEAREALTQQEEEAKPSALFDDPLEERFRRAIADSATGANLLESLLEESALIPGWNKKLRTKGKKKLKAIREAEEEKTRQLKLDQKNEAKAVSAGASTAPPGAGAGTGVTTMSLDFPENVAGWVIGKNSTNLRSVCLDAGGVQSSVQKMADGSCTIQLSGSASMVEKASRGLREIERIAPVNMQAARDEREREAAAAAGSLVTDQQIQAQAQATKQAILAATSRSKGADVNGSANGHGGGSGGSGGGGGGVFYTEDQLLNLDAAGIRRLKPCMRVSHNRWVHTRAMSDGRKLFCFVHCPAQLTGLLIGHGGNTIASIMKESGAFVAMIPRNGDKKMALVYGPRSSVLTARGKVLSLLKSKLGQDVFGHQRHDIQEESRALDLQAGLSVPGAAAAVGAAAAAGSPVSPTADDPDHFVASMLQAQAGGRGGEGFNGAAFGGGGGGGLSPRERQQAMVEEQQAELERYRLEQQLKKAAAASAHPTNAKATKASAPAPLQQQLDEKKPAPVVPRPGGPLSPPPPPTTTTTTTTTTTKANGKAAVKEAKMAANAKAPVPVSVPVLEYPDTIEWRALAQEFKRIECEAFLPRFLEQDITDLETAALMEDADLVEFNIPAAPRKRILDALKNEVKQDAQCDVCYNAPKTNYFLPCRCPQNVCATCAESTAKKKGKCVTCQKQVESTIRVYRVN